MSRTIRTVMWVVSLGQILLALGFVVGLPEVTRIWPLTIRDELGYTFIGSILAAAAASTIWCLYAHENAGLAGIALDYIAIMTPLVVLMLQLGAVPFALVCGAMALFGVWLFRMTIGIPPRDRRPTPRLVYWSFAAFVVALVLVGGALVLKTPNILPWMVSPEGGAVFGWMFLGAAVYFAYGLARPGWYNAGSQLAGFLAYDLVLIAPFLRRLPFITPELQLSLTIYLIVILYSGILAVYYLFINPATRLFGLPVAVAPKA